MDEGMKVAVGIVATAFGLMVLSVALGSWLMDINFCGLWSGAFEAIASSLPFGGSSMEIPCPWPF